MEWSVLSPNALEALERVCLQLAYRWIRGGWKRVMLLTYIQVTHLSLLNGVGDWMDYLGFSLCMNFRGNIYHDVS